MRRLALIPFLLAAACGGPIDDNGQAANEPASNEAQQIREVRSTTTTTSTTTSGGGKKGSTSTTSTSTTTASPSAVLLSSASRSVAPVAAGSYDIASTYSVEIATRWQIAGAPSSFILDVVTPWNDVYQHVELAVNADTCVDQGDGSCIVWYSMLVRGTVIVDYGMAGQWATRASLIGAASPLASGGFELK